MRTCLLILCCVALVSSCTPTAHSEENRTEKWKAVDEAIKKGLPKTAITHLAPIIKSAMADGAYAEAIKAIGRKIALEGTIQGNKPEEKIVRLQAEIAKAPPAMNPSCRPCSPTGTGITSSGTDGVSCGGPRPPRRPAMISRPGT